MKPKNIQKEQTYKLESYNVKQYEGERLCEEVVAQEDCSIKRKWVLVYSSKQLANILVPVNDLYHISEDEA